MGLRPASIDRWARRTTGGARLASPQSVVWAVLQFALTGMAAVAVLGLVAVQILQHIGESEAIRDAKHETQLAGRGIISPRLRAGILSGDAAALASLDNAVHRYVLRDPVVRVKLWDARGRILYSDEARLNGMQYHLRNDEMQALRTGGVDAEVSDLAKPENRFERKFSKLLEVYLGIRGPGGRPLLYEEYLKYSSVAASGNRLWSSFGPALIATLILLELAQIPLAWSLARRLRRRQQEREVLLRRAIEASDVERRRIARELHDGVVQNLVGVSYTLAATAATRTDPDAAAALDRAASETRDSIRELRTLLVEIYPPALERAGLASAVSDLVAPLNARGIATDIDLETDLNLADQTEQILYRVAQESVRNVAKHADASVVTIKAGREDGIVFLTVEDDGCGFDQGLPRDSERERHFGLRILHDLAREAGGALIVKSGVGTGTCVRVEVPGDDQNPGS